MSRDANGIHYRPDGTKTFIPLENNPEVFTQLVHKLGVSPELGFYDVYSIDEPDLLALVPRPVHALIFIAPAPVYHKVRHAEHGGKSDGYSLDSGRDDAKALTYDGSGDEEPVVWFKQTIGHACGLIALLHSTANGPARQYVLPGSALDNFLIQAIPLKPRARAQCLYDSADLEKAHMSVALNGDTAAPLAAEPNGYHFISFVRGKDGHLYELEGGSSTDGPIDRGILPEDEDMLGETALAAGVRRFVGAAEGNLEFSMVALASKPE